jgi:hypothetical protein
MGTAAQAAVSFLLVRQDKKSFVWRCKKKPRSSGAGCSEAESPLTEPSAYVAPSIRNGRAGAGSERKRRQAMSSAAKLPVTSPPACIEIADSCEGDHHQDGEGNDGAKVLSHDFLLLCDGLHQDDMLQ